MNASTGISLKSRKKINDNGKTWDFISNNFMDDGACLVPINER